MGIDYTPSDPGLVALLSSQGTACSETAICRRCDGPSRRAIVERIAAADTLSDPAVPGTWADCSDNDALRCAFCGARHDAQDGAE